MAAILPLLPSDHLDIEVHPLAAIFPMLGDDELDELAADIKENGLLHPIVRMIDGRTIVDGRNRLEACKRAKVKPTFDDRIRDDDEARSVIVSANLHRRNMSKGQQAMALATIYPEPKNVRRKGSGVSVTERQGVTAERLSLARTVLRVGPDDLAPAVLSGAQSLDDAYTEAQRRRNAATSGQGKLVKLQSEAPDLAALVTEERMTLGEAVAALDQRKADRQRIIDTGRRAADRVLDLCGLAVSIAGAAEHGERGMIDADKLKQLDDAMTLLRRIYDEGEDRL